ncbi:hypothetical protein SAMD00019534_072070 [Acytostelium subglobosum LB1]|uniref:hypothetical protein n=1 Tax=Acytostelium subglobosum LB1 TaxID=1410327 RepID=UPI0006451540|nr:hypothetical protein SAMD00019534_072070 [Acytostelium subglobosum LB1]GAM24032.1 hypothetical protein SAMD00019534_072070 [Acytostelium subglobosum LB1]|eukprot:XP_012753068.1 hypothetical protein SAMD00019534_072070 [Acytostelium subglobosum LB1]
MSLPSKQAPKLFESLKKTRLWKLYRLDSNWSEHNDVTLFFDGDDTFMSMWDSIENAKHSINMETYTIEPDSVGLRTIQLLTAAQRRGCKVKFVYDAIGSSSISDSHLQELKDSGATLIKFNPFFSTSFPIMFRNHRKMIVVDEKIGYCGGMNISEKYAGKVLGTSYFRDTHVKIEGPVVKDLLDAFYSTKKDKQTLFSQQRSHLIQSGTTRDQDDPSSSSSYSSNIPTSTTTTSRASSSLERGADSETAVAEAAAASEAGKAIMPSIDPQSIIPDLGRPMDDSIRDKILYDRYHEYFSDFYNEEDNRDFDDEDDDDDYLQDGEDAAHEFDENKMKVEDVPIQVWESNLMRGKRNLQRGLSILLKNCNKNCYLTSAYFMPPRLLRKAIIDTASRGVEVKILTAGISDVPWVRMAGQHIYRPFLEKGVKIYEMTGTRLHSKTITIDGKYNTIGSYNLDHWSQRNLEVCVSITDERVAKYIERQFHEDLKQSEEITLEYLDNKSLFNKIYSFLAYQFGRIVRPTDIK